MHTTSRKWFLVMMTAAGLLAGGTLIAEETAEADPIGTAVEAYFKTAFERLEAVAAQQPTKDTLRKAMKPLAEATDGFFGGTLIDTNFVIREVYNPRDFLARGFDLNKVKQLTVFWKEMRETPAPQLSEPARGNIMQPRLIAMRYPVVSEGKLLSIVSVMIRTEAFLEATGLDECKGYRITCRGVKAEEDGKLTPPARSVTVKLPSNEWLIEYSL